MSDLNLGKMNELLKEQLAEYDELLKDKDVMEKFRDRLKKRLMPMLVGKNILEVTSLDHKKMVATVVEEEIVILKKEFEAAKNEG